MKPVNITPMQAFKDKDVELWTKWKQSRSSADLESLLKQVNQIIQRQVSNQRGSLPDIFLELKAKEYAKEAFESFNPAKGVALSTHVYNNLKQLSRLNSTYKSSVRAPEHQVRMAGQYLNTVQSLTEELGRTPTTEEKADSLGWNVKEIARLEKATRSELSDAKDIGHELQSSFSHGADDVDPLVTFFYHELNPQDQLLFEYSTGYGGRPILNNTALAKKLGITYSQLSYKRKLLIDKLKQRITQHGTGIHRYS